MILRTEDIEIEFSLTDTNKTTCDDLVITLVEKTTKIEWRACLSRIEVVDIFRSLFDY